MHRLTRTLRAHCIQSAWHRHLRRALLALALGLLAPAMAGAADFAVAVWDFDWNTVAPDAAPNPQAGTDALADQLSAQLLALGGTQVVERTRLKDVMAELKLGSSSLASEDARLALGRMVGARFMVFGSGLQLMGMYRLDVRVVAVETSRIEAAQELSGDAPALAAQVAPLARTLALAMFRAELARSGPRGGAPAGPATPDTLATLYLAGLERAARKDGDGALDAFRQVLAQAPDFVPARRSLQTVMDQLSTQ